MNPCARCPYSAVCLSCGELHLIQMLHEKAFVQNGKKTKNLYTLYDKLVQRAPDDCPLEYDHNEMNGVSLLENTRRNKR